MRIEPELLRRAWFLAGPTACGKSAVAMELADRIGGEIVALDSMTLYRGLDIGTAKPTAADRARVSHHLFDILDPHEEFSVAEYVAASERTMRDIVQR
ncbi:MAG TPA: isopentenyl transferase family protein, partial [Planctomycetaceae bacterium]|nr:isopentenyl transferase family protein [Planctomycetaceae bacterium]